MQYLGEFRTGWRPLLGATLAMGTGFSAMSPVTSLMAPHFLKEFSWSMADFAFVGTMSIFMSLFIPIAGRMGDVLGVRRTAAIGVVVLPICLVALSMMTGDIRQYYALFIIQAAFCVTTTASVLSRVVVEYFKRARGLAMAIAASGPGITGVVLGPLLNNFVEAQGWRTGYVATAAFVFLSGCIALWLIPGRRTEAAAPAADSAGAAIAPPRRRSWADYPAIFRTPAFWILIVAMVLCNLHQVLILTQMNLLVIAQGITDPIAISTMISVFWGSTIVGRFSCGLAIDRLPGNIVAAIGMGMPSIGLFLFASSVDSYWVVLVAIMFVGLAFGAEGDLIGVLVARAFGVAIYGSVMGLVTGAISLASASGAGILGLMLKGTNSFDTFLLVTGTTVLLGSLLFLLLPKNREPEEHTAPPQASTVAA